MTLLLLQVAGEKTADIAAGLEKSPLAWGIAICLAAIVFLFGVMVLAWKTTREDLMGALGKVDVARDEKMKLLEEHAVLVQKLYAEHSASLLALALGVNALATEYKLRTEGLEDLIRENVRVLKAVGSKDPRVRELIRRGEAEAGDEVTRRASEKFGTGSTPVVPTPPVVPP